MDETETNWGRKATAVICSVSPLGKEIIFCGDIGNDLVYRGTAWTAPRTPQAVDTVLSSSRNRDGRDL